MGDLSDKAQEFAGRAKEAAGEVTGDDNLRAEGTADKAEAEVKQKVDETASDTRTVTVLAVAGAVIVAALLLRRRRTSSPGSSRSSGKRHKGRAVATKAVTAGLKEAIVR